LYLQAKPILTHSSQVSQQAHQKSSIKSRILKSTQMG
jgi:hypothetical protein